MKQSKHFILIGVLLLVIAGGWYMAWRSKNESRMQGGDSMNGQPVAQSHRSYVMEITSSLTNVTPGKPVTVTYRVKNDQGKVIKNFETVHEKIMHFIIVRKDLGNFQHLHPTFNQSTGEFSASVTFPTDGPYRMFLDFTPGKTENNPMELAVTLNEDVNVGDMAKYRAIAQTPDTATTKTVNGYDVTINFPNRNNLKSLEEINFHLDISRNGQSVTNLETYLGALGHSVILLADTLDFIHTHPPEAGGGHMAAESPTASGPKISFAATLPESGTYKIFTQFQHQGQVQTVDYTISVK